MLKIELRDAERKQSKIRVSMSGPSGSGKTYSALLLASGLADNWNKIALIDTENKRGDIYSDLGKYKIITLESPFTPERFIEAIHACEEGGMQVIIIDSLSHEWDGPGGCLEMNEKLAASKFKGNTWAAWSETTPRHQRLIQAIIASPCHVINTMRSKTDTIQTDDKKIKKVGLKDIQREGFEYEMTVSFNIDRDTHCALVGKDNTRLFEGRDPFIISSEDGKKIIEWNTSGAVDYSAIKSKIMTELKRVYVNDKFDTKEQVEAKVKQATTLNLTESNYQKILDDLKVLIPIEKIIEPIINKPAEDFFPEEVNQEPVQQEPAPNLESVSVADNTLISSQKLNTLRQLAITKTVALDDEMLLSYVNFILNVDLKNLSDMTNDIATKLYKEIMHAGAQNN